MRSKIKEILEIIKNHEIQIVDFLILNQDNNEEEFKKISFDSSFIDEDFFLNGFENEKFNAKKIIPNLNFYFFNLFSSKISLQIICNSKEEQDFFQNNHLSEIYLQTFPKINFFVEIDDLKKPSENLLYDFCSEIFEVLGRIEAKFFYKPRNFFMENIIHNSKSYKNIIFELYVKNDEIIDVNQNFLNFFYSLLILKNVIKNVAKTFDLEAIFLQSFLDFSTKKEKALIPLNSSKFNLLREISNLFIEP